MTTPFDPAQHPRNGQHGAPGNPGAFTAARHDDAPTTISSPDAVLSAARSAIDERKADRRHLEDRLAATDHELRLAARTALIAGGQKFAPQADALMLELAHGEPAPTVAGIRLRGEDGWVDAPMICEVELTEYANLLGGDEVLIADAFGDSDYYISDRTNVRWWLPLN
ncbi:hypothetical protein [Curtobacterium sp. MCSS17_016]|uniref:hypothetical protein n=1 Tax=Curtobacterium sp. MCSS17_016 TaxID=2175644 RepID=UPI000DA8CCC9|nr:hypothetical protein [Curtobacterium sp. MCSS17_016]WIE81087.1 hypothetical protein DEJ19_021660 [Curtobacterium sp. MCSS17_016]